MNGQALVGGQPLMREVIKRVCCEEVEGREEKGDDSGAGK